MKYYFTIQFRRLIRTLKDWGINPVLSCLWIPAVFIVLSMLLFEKTEYATWIYCLMALSITNNLGKVSRNEQLNRIFENAVVRNIRMLENGIVLFPFILFLVFQKEFLFILVLAIISILLALVSFRIPFSGTITTPFSRRPFEFTIGFRNSLLILMGNLCILAKAIQVENYYLGLFTLGLTALISMSYYVKPEVPYFVWIFDRSVLSFLKMKILWAWLHYSILSLPFLIALAIAFPPFIGISLLIQGLAYFYLIAIVLAKYSAFPHEMNIPQGLLLAICFIFPPFLLLVIPIFLRHARRRLEPILA